MGKSKTIRRRRRRHRRLTGEELRLSLSARWLAERHARCFKRLIDERCESLKGKGADDDGREKRKKEGLREQEDLLSKATEENRRIAIWVYGWRLCEVQGKKALQAAEQQTLRMFREGATAHNLQKEVL